MNKSSNTTRSNRTGSTLTEVLIAVIVLGVGAVSVMTLFPVAALRAIKSNQITQSTILRYHAETAVGAYDLAFVELFYGPNRRPGDGTVTAPFPYWEPGPNGQLGAPPPDYDDFPRYDINLFFPRRYTLNQFNAFTAAAGVHDDFGTILIDPLGFYRMGGDVAPDSNAAKLFGGGNFEPEVLNNSDGERAFVLPRVTGGHRGNNTNTGNDPNGISWRNRLKGGNLPPGEVDEARALVTLPDQYSTLIDAPIVAVNNASSVTLPNELENRIMDEIASFAVTAPIRVTLFDLIGNGHVRTLDTSIVPPAPPNPNRILHFTPDLPDDPNTGNPIAIERAIIQQVNTDFTWMISARTEPNVSPGVASEVEMDVIVFFKRPFAEADERIFYTQVLDSSTSTGLGGGRIGSIYNKVRINFSGDPPFAKKGGYLFDTQNNRWYRILEITLETSTQLEMILEHAVRDDDGNAGAGGTFWITSAFPRGVIDVFPIGTKTSKHNVNP